MTMTLQKTNKPLLYPQLLRLLFWKFSKIKTCRFGWSWIFLFSIKTKPKILHCLRRHLISIFEDKRNKFRVSDNKPPLTLAKIFCASWFFAHILLTKKMCVFHLHWAEQVFVILIAFVLTNENVELVNQFRLNLEKKREKSNQIK